MSKADNLAAALGRGTAPVPPSLELAAPAPRTVPFKMTVLLAGDLRQILRDYPERMRLPDRTGKAVIPGADVIRALIRELEGSQELQTAVAKRIIAAVEEDTPS